MAIECGRLKEDNKKLAHDQSQLQDRTTKMKEELKSKCSRPPCSFCCPPYLVMPLHSDVLYGLQFLKINAKKHLEDVIKDRDGWKT